MEYAGEGLSLSCRSEAQEQAQEAADSEEERAVALIRAAHARPVRVLIVEDNEVPPPPRAAALIEWTA